MTPERDVSDEIFARHRDDKLLLRYIFKDAYHRVNDEFLSLGDDAACLLQMQQLITMLVAGWENGKNIDNDGLLHVANIARLALALACHRGQSRVNFQSYFTVDEFVALIDKDIADEEKELEGMSAKQAAPLLVGIEMLKRIRTHVLTEYSKEGQP